jgi:hypothetical protein
MVYRELISRPITAAGLLGLSLTAGGCPDGEIVETSADDGPYCDDGYCTTTYDPPTPTTYDPTTTNYCLDYDCYCLDYGCYEDDGPYPTTYYYPPTTEITFTTVTSLPETETLFTTETTDTSTGTDTSTSTDTDTTSTGTDTDTTSTGTDTDTDTDTDTTTDGLEGFPPPGEFGDADNGVIELDLVGTWSLQWAPDATTFDSVITIDDTGNFLWRETSADCTVDTLATGFLWVEPGQLVLHVETWERALPWDTLVPLGQEFPPPFRLRMSYALLGPNLALAAPDRITTPETYTGRAYLQSQSQGMFIAGTWIGETELLAIPMGEQTAKVIVRDRFIATLDPEPNVDPESTGIVVHDQVFWGADPPVAGPTIFEGGNWTCLDGCPQPAGATLINGGNLYAYGPYAGFQRLATFTSGRMWKRDVDTDCP